MLTAEERARVAVVLVRARNPANIGAVARAMHDFGFGQLRAVSEYMEPVTAARSAVDAGEVIAAATTYAAMADGVADRTLVLGTTAVGERVLEHPVWVMAEASERVQAHLRADAGHRVALVFGSEKTGLSNAELAHCHALVTIPMAPHAGVRHASMNLGQAAAVCLYELVRSREATVVAGREELRAAGAETSRAVTSGAEATAVKAAGAESLGAEGAGAQATAAEVERLRLLFTEVLERTGYTRRYPANSDEDVMRRMVLRTRPAATEVGVWMGVLRQVLWALKQQG